MKLLSRITNCRILVKFVRGLRTTPPGGRSKTFIYVTPLGRRVKRVLTGPITNARGTLIIIIDNIGMLAGLNLLGYLPVTTIPGTDGRGNRRFDTYPITKRNRLKSFIQTWETLRPGKEDPKSVVITYPRNFRFH